MNRDSRRRCRFLSIALGLGVALLAAAAGAQQLNQPLYGAPTLNQRNPDATNRAGQHGWGNDNQEDGSDQDTSGNADDPYAQQGIQGNGYDQNPATGNVAENPFGASPGLYENSPRRWGDSAEGEAPEADAQDDRQQRDWTQPPGTYPDGDE